MLSWGLDTNNLELPDWGKNTTKNWGGGWLTDRKKRPSFSPAPWRRRPCKDHLP